MLADFYIPGLSNDMKIDVQKNNLWGQIWYRSLDPVKKNGGFFTAFEKIPKKFRKITLRVRVGQYLVNLKKTASLLKMKKQFNRNIKIKIGGMFALLCNTLR